MKKIFTLFVALITFSAVFSQRNTPYNNYPDNYNTTQNNGYYNDNGGYNNRPDRGVVIVNDNDRHQRDYGYNNGYNNNYDRRAEMQRINRDYDRRINDYRNNRRLNSYDRNYQIRALERERNEKLKSFGGGVLLGGILGVILGSNL